MKVIREETTSSLGTLIDFSFDSKTPHPWLDHVAITLSEDQKEPQVAIFTHDPTQNELAREKATRLSVSETMEAGSNEEADLLSLLAPRTKQGFLHPDIHCFTFRVGAGSEIGVILHNAKIPFEIQEAVLGELKSRGFGPKE